MPISSFLVHARNTKVDSVAGQLAGLEGVTVTDIRDDRIVALTETDSRREDDILWKKMQDLPGVITLNMIYHNFEDLENGDDE